MINVVVTWLSAYIRREQGQDLIEYALLGGLIAAAIVAVIALGAMTGAIEDMATGIGDCIDFDDITNCDPT
jgi:Flp pilus assembly pilin Flp